MSDRYDEESYPKKICTIEDQQLKNIDTRHACILDKSLHITSRTLPSANYYTEHWESLQPQTAIR